MYIKWFFEFLLIALAGILLAIIPSKVWSADTNTVSSTVVTDKSVPTANAPSIVVNNNDVCRSGMSVGAQTGIFGLSTGHTIIDKNCERIKLARSLYFMGMKVAAVSLLCQDARVFDAMTMAGTPCPYKGKIGNEAKVAWEKDWELAPEDNTMFREIEEEEIEEEEIEEEEIEEEEIEEEDSDKKTVVEEEYPGQGD